MSKPVQVQIVERALQIISDPKHWAIGAGAVRQDGRNCAIQDEDAFSFCASGAIWRAAMEVVGEEVERVLRHGIAPANDPVSEMMGKLIVDLNRISPESDIVNTNDKPAPHAFGRDPAGYKFVQRAQNHPVVLKIFRDYLEEINGKAS